MSIGFAPDCMQNSVLHVIFLGMLFGTVTINYVWPVDYLTNCPAKYTSTCVPFFGCIKVFVGYDCTQNACQRSIANTLPKFDYIIVGSGAAGSVLAYRLAQANTARTVLLIEAGNIPIIESVSPRMFPFNLNNSAVFNYKVQPSTQYAQAFREGMNANCGKSIGGSTQVNAMIYVCGADSDYNQWAVAANDSSWSYVNILQYIKKHQNMQDATLTAGTCGSYHSTTGPLKVNNVGETADPFNQFIRQASVDEGYPQLNDINCGPPYTGFANVRFTIAGGQRNSAARAFLLPIAGLSNFYMIYNTTVNKVLATRDAATGSVLVTGVNVATGISNCSSINILASREVILSAGGYGSPQVLQRSGFGKAADLAACGTTQMKELPVGDNLADHVVSLNYYTVPYISVPDARTLSVQTLAYQTNLTAWGTIYAATFNDPYFPILSSANIQGFINVDSKAATYPHVQVTTTVYDQFQADFNIILNERFGFKSYIAEPLLNASNYYQVVQVMTTLLKPNSRGTVKLGSCTDPRAAPIITGNYLSDAADLATLIKGVKAVCALFNTPTMVNRGAQPHIPDIAECAGLAYCSDAYVTCYLKYMTINMWHPTGTCRMGSSAATAVVDSKLQVFGVKRGLSTTRTNPMLRVCDASVIPAITSGNTQCPTYTIGEKCAAMVIADNP